MVPGLEDELAAVVAAAQHSMVAKATEPLPEWPVSSWAMEADRTIHCDGDSCPNVRGIDCAGLGHGHRHLRKDFAFESTSMRWIPCC